MDNLIAAEGERAGAPGSARPPGSRLAHRARPAATRLVVDGDATAVARRGRAAPLGAHRPGIGATARP